MKRTNICLVGCGGMASLYRHRYNEIKDAKLCRIIDTNIDSAKAAAKELGVNSYSDNFDTALNADIDIVDISTPNFLHKEQAVKAMQSGKSVLLQKPIAPTLEDAKEIVTTSIKEGSFAGIYMSMFDCPIYYDVMDIVKNGILGSISSVYCRGAHQGGLIAPENGWRKSLDKTGGGALIQLGIHPVNMAAHILNQKIIKVAAISKNIMCPNIGGDDITNACCEFESGIQGTIEASYCSDLNILTIYGSEGFVSVVNDSRYTIKLNSQFEGRVINYQSGTINSDCKSLTDLYKQNNPYDQHIKFIQDYQNNRKPFISLSEGYYDLAVVKAIYQSALRNEFVYVKDFIL